MTLEQAYFVSQIVAAVVLVASIIFLALQVRQNSKVLERSMMEDHRASQNSVIEEIFKNREFAEFHMRAGENYDALDEIDKYRAQRLATWRVRRICHVIQAKRDGFASDVDWAEFESTLKTAARRKNIQLAWVALKNDYPKPIRIIFESIANS